MFVTIGSVEFLGTYGLGIKDEQMRCHVCLLLENPSKRISYGARVCARGAKSGPALRARSSFRAKCGWHVGELIALEPVRECAREIARAFNRQAQALRF